MVRSLTTGKYTIDVADATEADIDNRQYTHITLDPEYRNSMLSIAVYADDRPVKSILIGAIGGGTGVHQTSLIMEGDRLITCCANSLFCISIPDLEVVWRVRADDATCFEVCPYQSDYIVHGELAISRVSHDGDLLWEYSGRDIFTSLEGKNDFIIMDDHIQVSDWDHRVYHIGFDGETLDQ